MVNETTPPEEPEKISAKTVEIPEVPVTPSIETVSVPEIKSLDNIKPMSRIERRIIISKLNDVYVDEKIGYRGDWSDGKVATDLGVPVQWVAEIRDENFGPEDINEADTELAKKMTELEHMAAEVLAAIKEYDAAVDAIDTKIEAFDKANAEMRALLIEHRNIKEKRNG
jgi:hypothetical protein